jgi:hypothetical protein
MLSLPTLTLMPCPRNSGGTSVCQIVIQPRSSVSNCKYPTLPSFSISNLLLTTRAVPESTSTLSSISILRRRLHRFPQVWHSLRHHSVTGKCSLPMPWSGEQTAAYSDVNASAVDAESKPDRTTYTVSIEASFAVVLFSGVSTE